MMYNEKIRVFILLVVLIGLGFSVYRVSLYSLALSVLHREGSSHGVFVPFISGFFLWLKWKSVKHSVPRLALVPGTLMVAAGLLMFYQNSTSTEVALPALSFFLVTAGLVIGLFGKQLFKEAAFPLFFLVTMIPLPEPLYARIAEWMKAINTAGSVWVLQLLHFPLYREGYTISLPNMNLLVANSCSGIRYLLSYFVFGLAYAFLFKKTMRSRIVVILATIPISIMSGVLRLSAIFLSVYFIGPFMAGHRPHILVSWSVFLGVLAGAIWVDRYISRTWGKGRRAKSIAQRA